MLPNLVVIGAQKCGTSALHYYLGLHPEISMSSPKELNFFIKPDEWRRGVEWYEGHFSDGAAVRGESSPNYTSFPRNKGVPRRMSKVLPDAKLIYLVRDPLERIVSAYIHNLSRGREKRGLTTALAKPRSTYLVRSRYYRQVEGFLDFYPPSQLLILEQDDLLNRRPETLAATFRFLGVDDSFWSPRYERLRHETRNKLRLRRDVRSRLEDDTKALDEYSHGSLSVLKNMYGLKRDIDRFREFTGRDFADWSL
jgi:hypothetical protein